MGSEIGIAMVLFSMVNLFPDVPATADGALVPQKNCELYCHHTPLNRTLMMGSIFIGDR